MCFGATAESVTLYATLEPFAFRSAYDVNRFASGEKTGVNFCAEFNSVQAGTILQPNLAQHFERPQLGTWAALAVLRYLEQLLDLLIFFLARGGFRLGSLFGSLFPALLLLIGLQAFALRFQQGQAMSKMPQLWASDVL